MKHKKYYKKILVNILLSLNIVLLTLSNSISSEKNITYMQILQNPNDLDLNQICNDRERWVILNKQSLLLRD